MMWIFDKKKEEEQLDLLENEVEWDEDLDEENNEIEALNEVFSTHRRLKTQQKQKIIQNLTPVTPFDHTIQSTNKNVSSVTLNEVMEETGMDASTVTNIKGAFNFTGSTQIPTNLLSWYGLQTFPSYQALSIMAQHWLVDKACSVKGRDAVRNGYHIVCDDGQKIDVKIINYINKKDIKYNICKEMEKADKFRNIHGIRHVLFEVEGIDKSKPFNPDGIKPNAYKGIRQIEPYWITPELSYDGFVNAASPNFYEPEYWYIQGELIHKSHFVILRGPEVSDILKPSYRYGGISLVQRIYERVYAAERTANEAPLLALTKRLYVQKVNLNNIIGNSTKFLQNQELANELQNNFGKLFIGLEEELEKHDTSLSDFNNLMAGQYHLIASISNTPITKLFGEAPSGFQATGEFDMKSYHQELESIQTDLSAILEMHHLCLMRSQIIPKFSIDFEIDHDWNSPAVMTEQERTEVAKTKSETAKNYSDVGAVDQYDVRSLIINDQYSGFTTIEEVERPEEEIELDPLEVEVAEARSGSRNPNNPETGAKDEESTGKDFVRKEDGLWYVFSEKGKRLSKGYMSKSKADERLRQIEYFKHHG